MVLFFEDTYDGGARPATKRKNNDRDAHNATKWKSDFSKAFYEVPPRITAISSSANKHVWPRPIDASYPSRELFQTVRELLSGQADRPVPIVKDDGRVTVRSGLRRYLNRNRRLAGGSRKQPEHQEDGRKTLRRRRLERLQQSTNAPTTPSARDARAGRIRRADIQVRSHEAPQPSQGRLPHTI